MNIRERAILFSQRRLAHLSVTSAMLYTALLLAMAIVEIETARLSFEPVVALIHETGAAAALLLAFMVLLGLCTVPIHRRVLEPSLHWRDCATLGAVEDVYHRSLGSFATMTLPRLENALARAGSTDPVQQANQTKRAFRATTRAGAWLSIIVLPSLWFADYLPVSPTWVVAAVVTIATLLLGLGFVRNTGGGANTSARKVGRRGNKSLIAAVSLEVAAAGGIVTVLWALQHTAGVPASGVGQSLAVALIARSLIHVSPTPLGLGLTDVVLVAGLILIGVSTPIAIATTLLWRVSTVIVLIGQIALVNLPPRKTALYSTEKDSPSEPRWGRLLHRWAFRLIGALPAFASSAVRRHVFETMFRGASDPWAYDTSTYEARKRNVLVSAIPTGVNVLVEFGCADGHNLVALAKERPNTKIIGVDVSAAAVKIATAKCKDFDNITVVRGDATECLARLSEYRGGVDVLIVAEMLYYLGGAKAIRQEISPLSQLLAPHARVVLLHETYDANTLHAQACKALEITPSASRTVEDPERPFTVTVAVTTKAAIL
jgi:precorrin-6B methylase 2